MNNYKNNIMKQLICELEQEELETIYGGEVEYFFLNGEWIVINK